MAIILEIAFTCLGGVALIEAFIWIQWLYLIHWSLRDATEDQANDILNAWELLVPKRIVRYVRKARNNRGE